jgi:hypothetical protein
MPGDVLAFLTPFPYFRSLRAISVKIAQAEQNAIDSAVGGQGSMPQPSGAGKATALTSRDGSLFTRPTLALTRH